MPAGAHLLRIDFYAGNTLIGSAPFAMNWNTTSPGYGRHAVTAKAIYSNGTSATSALARVTVAEAGDANLDGSITAGDLGALAGNWGASPATWQMGDFNGDGAVGAGDLGLLAGYWQQTYPLD